MSGLPDFDQLWDYNNFEQTESTFFELLPDARNSEGAGQLPCSGE